LKNGNKNSRNKECIFQFIYFQGLPVPAVGTSMAVPFIHVFLWGSSATNHIENALMGSPCLFLQNGKKLFLF
jgi:hypothetical protein